MKKLSFLLCFVLIFSLLLTACGEDIPPVVDPDDGTEQTPGGTTPPEDGGDETPTRATYVITVTDQNGDAVVGAEVSICTVSTGVCQMPVPTDANGVSTHTNKKIDTYAAQVVIPEGYSHANQYEDASGSIIIKVPFADGQTALAIVLVKGEDTTPGGDQTPDGGDDTPTVTPQFDPSTIPAWDGETEYVVVNGGVPFFTNEDTSTSYETYGELDSFGRCTVVIACIGQDLMPTDSKGSLSHEPTGWVQATYSCVPGSLYNRCHLIAWALTGENNNKNNLLTGTRFMNEAMIPFEEQTAAYIKASGDRVLYRVTPIFDGNNLLANGVLMEAMSVSDQGQSLQFCVYLYNCQPEITIDYATGESEGPEEEIPLEVIYILYTKKGKEKYHTPTCKQAASIGEANKKLFSGTYEEFQELVAAGYVPAGCCNPAPMTPPATADYVVPMWVEDYLALALRKSLLQTA